MAAPEVPHIAYPLRLAADGGLEQVEQDGLDDVRSCVFVIARTPRGARPLAPAVGVDDPTFSDTVDTDQLAAALEQGEPRAAVTVTADPVDEHGEQEITVQVALADDPEREDL